MNPELTWVKNVARDRSRWHHPCAQTLSANAKRIEVLSVNDKKALVTSFLERFGKSFYGVLNGD